MATFFPNFWGIKNKTENVTTECRRMTFFNECWPAGGGQATAAAFRVSGPEPEPGSGTRTLAELAADSPIYTPGPDMQAMVDNREGP